jgi:hypothetical protein
MLAVADLAAIAETTLPEVTGPGCISGH